MKCLLTGDDRFVSFQFLSDKCDKILTNHPEAQILTMNVDGIDEQGRYYARARNHSYKFIGPENTFDGRAETKQFQLVSEEADCMIAFWDGKQSKTKKIIDLMRSKNKPVRIVRYDRIETACACKDL